VVWQIGTFDDSSGEFNLGKPGPPFFGDRYPKELLYIVGKSAPDADWPARHLGSAIFQPGGHPRPYTIQFDLDEIPQGVYTLKVALLKESSCVGQLQVEVNGHVGLYYQHLKLSYTGGDREMVVSPISATDTILVDLPATFLHKGTNKFILTAVDEPSEAVGEAHSMLVYDALELEHDSARKFAADEMTAEVEPTVFYVHHGGGLEELVDVFVRHSATVQHGQISLTVAGQTFSEEMPARGFGEHRAEFSVPEFAAGTKAVVTVKADGHSRRFPVELTPARSGTFSSCRTCTSTWDIRTIRKRLRRFNRASWMKPSISSTSIRRFVSARMDTGASGNIWPAAARPGSNNLSRW
jgi:hypothetical protein